MISKNDRQIDIQLKLARRVWPGCIHGLQCVRLKHLLRRYGVSIAAGDLQILNGNYFVTSSGLLSLAYREHCWGLYTEIIRELCQPAASRWVFKAVVYKSTHCRGFMGYGDADATNVSPAVRGAEM